MTRGEAFDKAWRLGIKGDFSLYDEIVHTDYESINQGVKINRDVSKAVLYRVHLLHYPLRRREQRLEHLWPSSAIALPFAAIAVRIATLPLTAQYQRQFL